MNVSTRGFLASHTEQLQIIGFLMLRLVGKMHILFSPPCTAIELSCLIESISTTSPRIEWKKIKNGKTSYVYFENKISGDFVWFFNIILHVISEIDDFAYVTLIFLNLNMAFISFR